MADRLLTPQIPVVATTAQAGGGGVKYLSPTELAAAYVELTPSKNFTFPYNGHLLSFVAGVPFVADAPLSAALTAAAAPVS